MDFSVIFITGGIVLAVGALITVVFAWAIKKKEKKAEEARLLQEAEDFKDELLAQVALDRFTGYSRAGEVPEDEVKEDYESLTRKQAAARINHPVYYRRADIRRQEMDLNHYNDPSTGLVAAAIIADAITDNQITHEQQNEIEDLRSEVESLKDEVPSFEEEVSPEPEPQDTAPESSDDWSSSFSTTSDDSSASSSDQGWDSSSSSSSSSSSDNWDSGWSSSSSSSDSSSSYSSSSDSSSSWSSSDSSSSSFDSGSSFSGGSDW